MRIAYVSLHWPRSLSSGVGKKIDRQIKTWKAFGHEVRFFMHSENTLEKNLVPGEKFFFEPQTNLLQRELGRIRATKEMLFSVEEYDPDIIYLRDGMYVYPLHRLAHIAPVIEELNANDIEQHKGLGIIYYTYNLLTRNFLLSTVSGFSCVSNELTQTSSFKKYGKPTRVVVNGIELANIKPFPPPNNIVPRIFFIGTPYPWQGIDKLITLAEKYPDLEIDIVGYDKPLNSQKLPSNLTFHGFLTTDEYRVLAAKADIAMGTLALYRRGVEETSTLKTMEYLAMGLPTVLPYQETALGKLSEDFLLRIPNTEENIITHGDAVHQFAYDMRGKRVDRQVIASYIDSKIKERERLDFFKEIVVQAS